MKIGFIGFGEAAYNISLGLKGEGVTGIIAYDKMAGDPVMGPMVAGRAAEAEAALLDTAKEVAEQADVIFGAVPSSFALDVCDEIKDVLCEGKIYAGRQRVDTCGERKNLGGRQGYGSQIR